MTHLPIFVIIMLLLSGFTLPFLKPTSHLLRASLFVQGLAAGLTALALPYRMAHGPVTLALGSPETIGGIHLTLGPVEILMAAFFSLIAALIMGSALTTLEKDIPPARAPLFVLLFHLIHGSVLGLVLTSHLFNGFLLLEIIALTSAAMIALKDKALNLKAANKYLLFSSFGSGLVLLGIAGLYAPTGFLTLKSLQEAMPALLIDNPMAVHGSLALFTTGLGVKGALFPLHLWLPDAHGYAPTPVSALLSSLVIKAPPFLLLKLVSIAFAPVLPSLSLMMNILLGTAATGIIAASLQARRQTDLKRLIAYSSISQIGYVFLGIGLGTPAGYAMSLYHMIAHGLAKSCMFLSAGAFIEQTGCHDVSDFKGIGREMPFTLGLFTLCAFSMVGIPMLPGFISKFILALAVIHSGNIILLIVILLSSLLNAFYYFPVIISGYFGEENLKDRVPFLRVKPIKELIPLVLLCVMMILAGLFSGALLDILNLGLFAG